MSAGQSPNAAGLARQQQQQQLMTLRAQQQQVLAQQRHQLGVQTPQPPMPVVSGIQTSTGNLRMATTTHHGGLLSNRPPILVNQSPIRVAGPPPGSAGNPAYRHSSVSQSGRNIVINQPGVPVGSPGSQITVPLTTLQGLQPGQGIPTGQAGHLLVKTENGQYQILKVGHSGAGATSTNATVSQPPPGIVTSRPHPMPGPPPISTLHHGVAPISSSISSVSSAPPPSSVVNSLPTRPSPVVSSSPASNSPSRGPPSSVTVSSAASAGAAGGGGGAGGITALDKPMTPGTAKLKCRNFLGTLLKLAKEQPPNVARNVRGYIQALIDGKFEPEEFTAKLQIELKSSPQPALTPFLRVSLPYFRQALRSREIKLEGVRAPPPSLGPPTVTPNPSIVGALPSAPPTRPPISVIPSQRPPSMPPTRQLRPPQQSPSARAPQPPISLAGLRPSPGPIPGMIRPGMMNTPLPPGISTREPSLPPPSLPRNLTPSSLSSATAALASLPPPPRPTLPSSSSLSSIRSGGGVPAAATLSSSFNSSSPLTSLAVKKERNATTTLASSSSSLSGVGSSSVTSGGLLPGMGISSALGATSSSLPGASSSISATGTPSRSSLSTAGDEDINDVAAMGGVNLAEESQRMQTDLMSTQIRSCKDETFLQTGSLQKRIAKICSDRGLEDPSPEVIAMMSHATQDRLKTLIEKLSVIAEHRMDVIKLEGDAYEGTQDVKGQLKFLADLDRLEKRRHEEAEREMLLRAAKSRTKTEDPEKEKLKAKAKEMQRLEEEQMRQEKANNTALLAIGGPKKKLRLDESSFVPGGLGMGGSGLGKGHHHPSIASMNMRPRTKRVHQRDLMVLMEQEKGLKRSSTLWKAYIS